MIYIFILIWLIWHKIFNNLSVYLYLTLVYKDLYRIVVSERHSNGLLWVSECHSNGLLWVLLPPSHTLPNIADWHVWWTAAGIARCGTYLASIKWSWPLLPFTLPLPPLCALINNVPSPGNGRVVKGARLRYLKAGVALTAHCWKQILVGAGQRARAQPPTIPRMWTNVSCSPGHLQLGRELGLGSAWAWAWLPFQTLGQSEILITDI